MHIFARRFMLLMMGRRGLRAWLGGLSIISAVWACTGDDPVPIQVVTADSGPPVTVDGSTTDPALRCDGGLTACGDACVDLETNAKHCGKCDRKCGPRSSCTARACAPIELARNLDRPTDLVLTSTTALMRLPTSIVRCAKDGCALGASPLWTDAGYELIGPRISADEKEAFFLATPPASSAIHLFRASISDVTASPSYVTNTPLGGASPRGPVTDEREHFVPTPYRNLRCLRKDCSRLDIMFGDETPVSAALSPTHYVWTMQNRDDAVTICPRPAPGAGYEYDAGVAVPCAPITVLAATSLNSRADQIAVVDDVTYWTEVDDVQKTRIFACPLAGCAKNPTLIVEGERIDGFAVDASGAYFSNTRDGTIKVCRDLVNGCGTQAVTLLLGLSTPSAIAVDATAVYFLTGATPTATSLFRVTK